MRIAEAKKLRYGQTVYIKGQYDSNGEPSKARVTGKVQTWKTQPWRVRVPIKRGLYGYGSIDERNLQLFTLRRPAARKRKKAKRR